MTDAHAGPDDPRIPGGARGRGAPRRLPGLRARRAREILMTFAGWLQILVFFALVVAATRPLGVLMFRIFERGGSNRVERLFFRACGVDQKKEQTWLEYTFALLAFSAVSLAVTYAIERLQHRL